MTPQTSAPSVKSSILKRDALYQYVIDKFVGPGEGAKEQLSQDPSTIYVSGVLFPKSVAKDDATEGNEAKQFSDELSPSEAYEMAVHATKIRPSSMGISVVLPAISSDIHLSVSYATYNKVAGKFARQAIEHAVPVVTVLDKVKYFADWATPDGLACVRLIKQPHKQGLRLTCFLVNDTKGKDQTKLFQCLIDIKLTGASGFIPVDNSEVGPSHIDDRILRLQFRNIRPYASAFGCSADWGSGAPYRLDSYGPCRRPSQNHSGSGAAAAGTDESHAQWYRGNERHGWVLTLKSQLGMDSQIQISVHDTGPGLPLGKGDQIFDAFFTTKAQGSGMGLAISRSIVESHGGRLWATSNDGQGATFHFSLPATPADAA